MSQLFGIKKNYSYQGKLNKPGAFPAEFIEICKMRQESLKTYLSLTLEGFYPKENIDIADGYIVASGTDPVVLTAHMDTVHHKPVKDYYTMKRKDGHHVISSPQGIGGDDRCGVFMIINILRTTDFRPTVIFCEDEEIGGIGSNKFLKTSNANLDNIKFFIELDRANENDAVFYEDENIEFHNWVMDITGYEENFGSFSDISHFCPEIGTSGVNLSCGYYNPHTTDEYVVFEEMMKSIEATKKLLKAARSETVGHFKYMYIDKYSRDYLFSDGSTDECAMGVLYLDKDTEKTGYGYGYTENECWGDFFLTNSNVCFDDILDFWYEN